MNYKNEPLLNFNQEELEQLKQIVLARIGVMPEDVSISIGAKELNKKELMQHVTSADEIGKQMMAMDLAFLKDLASGAIYGDE